MTLPLFDRTEFQDAINYCDSPTCALGFVRCECVSHINCFCLPNPADNPLCRKWHKLTDCRSVE